MILKVAPLSEDILALGIDGVNQIWRDAKRRAVGKERTKTLIEELLKQIPMAGELLETKGVGIRTVSGFLAEASDISRIDNPKELQKLAGLALVENSFSKNC